MVLWKRSYQKLPKGISEKGSFLLLLAIGISSDIWSGDCELELDFSYWGLQLSNPSTRKNTKQHDFWGGTICKFLPWVEMGFSHPVGAVGWIFFTPVTIFQPMLLGYGGWWLVQCSGWKVFPIRILFFCCTDDTNIFPGSKSCYDALSKSGLQLIMTQLFDCAILSSHNAQGTNFPNLRCPKQMHFCNSGPLPVTPLKINMEHVLMEVWFRSVFSFLFMGDGCRFQPLIY